MDPEDYLVTYCLLRLIVQKILLLIPAERDILRSDLLFGLEQEPVVDAVIA